MIKKFYLMKASSWMLLTILITGGFIVGFLTHTYGWHDKIPVIKSIFVSINKNRSKNRYEDEGFPYFAARKRDGGEEILNIKKIEYPFTFIVYGDTREPAYPETDLVIEKIINENPAFVINTGDMVANANAHHWKIFDLFGGGILKSGIPMYPTLGNHEYEIMGNGKSDSVEERLGHYFKRFSILKNNRWYSFKYGNNLFLILDTNVYCSPGSEQYNWLVNKLSERNNGFVFISSHFPLHTKSPAHPTRKSEEILADMLENPPIEGRIKPDIVFTGHIHNYERYNYNNINYIITGGGGAEPFRVNRDKDDVYNIPGNTFHYCKVTVFEESVSFQMIRLIVDTGEWEVADSFTYQKE